MFIVPYDKKIVHIDKTKIVCQLKEKQKVVNQADHDKATQTIIQIIVLLCF